MLRFLQRRVGAKILLGYLVALSLMLLVGALASFRLSQIEDTVGQLTGNLAEVRGMAPDIANRTLLVRYFASRYIASHQQSDLDRFNTEFLNLEELLNSAGQQITVGERAALLQQIRDYVSAYGDAFTQAAGLIRDRQIIQSEVLEVKATLFDNKMTALRISVATSKESLQFLSVANTQTYFQTVRLNVTQYLGTGDERYTVLVKESYLQALDALATLSGSLTDPLQGRNCSDAQAALEAYYQGFQSIQADYAATREIEATRLEVLEPQISQTAAAIVASVESDYQLANVSTQTLVSQTQSVLVGV